LSALGEPAEPADPPELQAADAPQGPAPATALAEPLTRKELRVLELLASGYSNAAMAEKLFVSDSTVRTHLRSINLKLGARSRTQAVALARELRVLR
ncbi:helix-turn-helix domain-containing protein, partial [Delftia sp. ZNC0008]